MTCVLKINYVSEIDVITVVIVHKSVHETALHAQLASLLTQLSHVGTTFSFQVRHFLII